MRRAISAANTGPLSGYRIGASPRLVSLRSGRLLGWPSNQRLRQLFLALLSVPTKELQTLDILQIFAGTFNRYHAAMNEILTVPSSSAAW